MSGYNLDPQAAKESSNTGKFITHAGKYKGRITQAWETGSETSNARAINIDFETDTGLVLPRPIRLFTFGKDGSPIYGFKIVSALLACLRLHGIQPAQGKIKVYDFDAKGEVEKDAQVFNDLVGKEVGFILQEEEYTDRDGYLQLKQDGSPKTRIRIVAPFEAKTELMAAEILDSKSKPELITQQIDYISNNPVRKDTRAKRDTGGGQYGGYASESYTQDNQGHYHQPENAGQSYAEYDGPGAMDDEIPFLPCEYRWLS